MSRKLVKPETKKTPETKKSGAGMVAALICVAILCVVGLVFVALKPQNKPMATNYPEAIMFSYDQETGEVVAEEVGEEKFWEIYGE